MVSARHRHELAAALLLLFCQLLARTSASTITTAPRPTATPILNATCEFRTINYITDTLPQLCLRSSWSQANATLKSAAAGTTTISSEGQSEESEVPKSQTAPQNGATGETVSSGATATTSIIATTSPEAEPASATDVDAGELNDAAFLSFEEWKKQTLEKAGQGNANIGNRRSGENKRRDSESFQNNLDTLGDEGELELDFSGFGGAGNSDETGNRAEKSGLEAKQEKQDAEGRKRDHYRSKDAGKTCKERFSYASFDAGATILKTHSGAKNSKAILIENKDSYMLSNCKTENKFVIIELSV